MGLFRKTLAIIAISLLGLLIIANILIDNPLTHKFLKSAINKELSQTTYLKTEFERINVRLLPLRATAFGVSVIYKGEDDSSKEEKALYFSSVGVSISIIDLILGKKRVSSFDINGLNLSWPLSFDLDTVFKKNKKKPADKMSWPPEFDIPVSKISIINSKLYFKNRGKKSIFEMGSEVVNIRLKTKSWEEISGNISFDLLNASKDGLPILESAKFSSEFKYSKNYLDFSKITLNSKKLKISGVSKSSLLSRVTRIKAGSDEDTSSKVVQNIKEPLDKLTSFLRKKVQKKTIGIKVNLTHDLQGDLGFLGSILDIPKVDGPIEALGELNLSFNFDNRKFSTVTYAAKVKSNNARFFDFNLMQSVIDLQVIKDRIIFQNIDFIDGKNHFMSAAGQLGFDDPINYDFDITPKNLKLSNIFKILNKEFKAVDFTLKDNVLDLKGVGKPFSMEISGKHQVDSFYLPALEKNLSKISPLCQSDIHIKIDKEHISFDNTKLKCAPPSVKKASQLTELDYADINFDGSIYFKEDQKLNLLFTSPNFNLRSLEFINKTPVSGVGLLRVKLSKAQGSVVADGFFDLKSTSAYGLQLGDLSGDLKFTKDQLSWNRIVSNYKGQSFIKLLNGTASNFKNLQVDTSIQAKNINLKQNDKFFETLFPDRGFRFNLNELNGRIKGPLAKPFLWDMSLVSTLSNVKLRGDDLFDLLRFRSKSDESVFSLSELTATRNAMAIKGDLNLKKSQQTLPFRGSSNSLSKFLKGIGANSQDELDAKVQLYSIASGDQENKSNQLMSLPFVGSFFSSLNLSGNAIGDISLRGKIEDINMVSDINIEKLRFKNTPLQSINFKSSLESDMLKMQLAQGQQLLANVNLDITDDNFFYDADIRASSFDLKWLLLEQVAPESLQDLRANLDWKISGSIKNWWQSEGVLVLSNINAVINDLTTGQLKKINIAQEKTARLTSKKGVWSLESPLIVKNDRFDLKVMPFKNKFPENLDIVIRSNIFLDILPKFYRKIESSSGSISASMSIEGPIQDPRIEAEAKCSDAEPVSLGVSSLRPSFENISCHVVYKKGVLSIRKLEANKGLGTVKVGGDLVLNKKHSVKNLSGIKVALDNAKFITPVKYFKFFDSILSGNLYIAGNKKPYQLSGTVNVLRAIATRDFNVDQEIVNNIRQKSYNFKEVTAVPLFDLNVDIIADKSIKVRNKILQTNFSSRLNIRRNSNSPLLSGQMTIHEGNFLYKRPFKLKSSFLVFDDPLKNDPNLDITATTDAAGRRIYLRLYGKLSNAIVDLTADPPTRDDGTPLSKLDLLVLISTGQLPETGQVVDRTGSAAQVEAINFFTNQFNRPLQKILDFSGQEFIREPTIKFEISKVTGGIVPRLDVPVNLKDNYNLNIGVNSSGAWEVSSEYPINESISLSGSFEGVNNSKASSSSAQVYDENRDAALDVKFRFNFK